MIDGRREAQFSSRKRLANVLCSRTLGFSAFLQFMLFFSLFNEVVLINVLLGFSESPFVPIGSVVKFN